MKASRLFGQLIAHGPLCDREYSEHGSSWNEVNRTAYAMMLTFFVLGPQAGVDYCTRPYDPMLDCRILMSPVWRGEGRRGVMAEFPQTGWEH